MRSAILTYHSVDGSGSIISVTPDLFRRQMQTLVERRVPVIPLDRILAGNTGVALTFDDGYQNFADAALPVLIEFHLSATVFVVSGLCGSLGTWKSAPGIPRLPLMHWNTVRQLPANLITLGSHSVSHPDLTRISGDNVAVELHDSRREIEDRTGRPVSLLAYPYGSVNAAVRAAAQRDYAMSCGTQLNYLGAEPDGFDLPRVDTYYLREAAWFEKVVTGGGQTYLGVRRFLRNVRRASSPGW
uniref:Polysaccharide deacetylase n=1 Tax=uncultured bacterium 89 TaxID=698393 RepID=E3T689_9BACT|nr:polysaccharide deacetylase [uncultured bacterium 89]